MMRSLCWRSYVSDLTYRASGEEIQSIGTSKLVRGKGDKSGPSTDFKVIFDRLVRVSPCTSLNEMHTTYKELDSVVLVRDVPEAGLRAGDLGAVVYVYGSEAVEVEFVTLAGRTQALRTLSVTEVRPTADDDLPAVRPTAGVPGAA